METFKLLLQAIEKGGVLATIVRVEGSAYRKTGTMMLFTKDGQQVGMISASCLEADVTIQAERLAENPHHFSKIIVYDMSREDDLGWGRGAGCNGKVHVLIEKIDEELKQSLEKVVAYLTKNIPVTIYKGLQSVPNKVTTSYHPQKSLPFSADMAQYPEEKWYVQRIYPQQRLIIFGAGPDAIPLIEVAQSIGFVTYVWDWRPNLLRTKEFNQAICFQDFKELDYYPTDYIVVMTHDFQHDQNIVQQIVLQQAFQYVGVLGPRKRMKRLLNGADIPPWINSPIGLSILAEGPEEIAISIMAEIIQVKNEVQLRAEKSHRNLFSSGKKYPI